MLDRRKRVNISNIAYAVYLIEKYKMGVLRPVVLLTQ